jgi:hypothetical protein
MDQVQVGRVTVGLETAVRWTAEYTDAETNRSTSDPYAYPAYDAYENETNDPRRITDADLLAPVLLNVGISIRAFYELQGMRGDLEAALAEVGSRPLAELTDLEVAELVQPLYGVLDDRKRHGVRGTTLSKVLHRKAPHCLVLHDRWVAACYVGGGAPVPSAKKRTWAEYMTLIHRAVRDDIRRQPEVFAALDAATGVPGQLTPVLLLDIVAWKSEGHCVD